MQNSASDDNRFDFLGPEVDLVLEAALNGSDPIDGASSMYNSSGQFTRNWHPQYTPQPGNAFESTFDRGVQPTWWDVAPHPPWNQQSLVAASMGGLGGEQRREYGRIEPGRANAAGPRVTRALRGPVPWPQEYHESSFSSDSSSPLGLQPLGPPYAEHQQTMRPGVRRSTRIAEQTPSTLSQMLPHNIGSSSSSSSSMSDTHDISAGLSPLPRSKNQRVPRSSQVRKEDDRCVCDNNACTYQLSSGQWKITSFTRRADLQRHEYTIHREDADRHSCTECEYHSKRRDKLWEHCRKVHKQSKGAERCVTQSPGLLRQRPSA